MIYLSPNYSADKVYRRYVKVSFNGLFEFMEVNEKLLSIRQDNIDFHKLPKHTSDEAIKLTGTCFPWVEWPIEKPVIPLDKIPCLTD